MREPLIAPGSPLTNFCARGTQLKGEIRTTVYTFYMDDSTPIFLSFLGNSYTVINWLRNHLWCPNDPNSLGIDDEKDGCHCTSKALSCQLRYLSSARVSCTNEHNLQFITFPSSHLLLFFIHLFSFDWERFMGMSKFSSHAFLC